MSGTMLPEAPEIHIDDMADPIVTPMIAAARQDPPTGLTV